MDNTNGTIRKSDEYRIVATFKISHHSGFSGYEQLINYVYAEKKIISHRGPPKNAFVKWFERGLRVFSLSHWYQMDGLKAELAAIGARLKQRKPVVLHYLYGDAALGYLPFFCKFLNIRLIVTVHSCPTDIKILLRKSYSLKAIDRFIVLGKNQIKPLIELGVEPKKISFVPHGVKNSAFAKQRQTKNDAVFRVLIVGNWKRRTSLYREILEYYSNSSDMEFIFVTRHSLPDELKDLRNLIAKEDIRDSELKYLYYSSDCMLIALEDAVANNVILESMAAGLPVVCEEVGAVHEYLGEDYPLFFGKNDYKKAIQRIDYLKQNSGYANEISHQLRARAIKFDWPNIAKSIELYY